MELMIWIRVLVVLIPAAVGIAAAVMLGRVLPRKLWSRLLQGVVAIGISLGLLLSGLNVYVNFGVGPQEDMVRRVATEKKIVALTFDDGPSPTYTPQILDILAEYQVPAAFFVVGAHAERHPDIVRRIAEEGHELGNHTLTHVNIPTTGTLQLAAELALTNFHIYEAAGVYPQYLRPPRGMYDRRLRQWAELMDMQIVLWSLSSQDWLETMTAPRITTRILSRVRPGDILLFHDSGAIVRSEGASRLRTVQALPDIIEGLWARGYEIVSLAELLAYPGVEPDPDVPPVY